jgi:hypothetical protein
MYLIGRAPTSRYKNSRGVFEWALIRDLKGRLQKQKTKSNWNFPIGVSTPSSNWKKKN